MKERPILFSGPMVRAILAGRKTMTRRIVKPGTRDDWNACPYGVIGDRLWVRETWQVATLKGESYPNLCFRSDSSTVLHIRKDIFDYEVSCGGKWRPSIFMPRWASRIMLEITGVRVERLQDMKLNDYEAEGFVPPEGMEANAAIQRFAELWNSINGKRASWESNPWVWVIQFKQVEAA